MLGGKQPVKKTIINKYSLSEDEPVYTLIVDGHSLLKNGILDSKTGTNGKVYGPIFQFFIHLRMMMQKKDWDYVYVVFDGRNSGQLRYDFYHEYKKDRDKNYASSEYDKKINEYVRKVIQYSKQKNGETKKTNPYDDKEEFERMKIVVNKMLEELFIRQYSFEEVEGDDIIAYYVANKLPNEKVVIMSGDRDLSQLISDNVALYDINLKKFITAETFKVNYGYHYSNVVTVKIMVGDSSDSIYGVERLGKPTLFEHFPELLERHVEVEEIVKKAKELNKKRVESGKKPLKIFENIENSVTKGSQGKRLYEINKKLSFQFPDTDEHTITLKVKRTDNSKI